MKIKDLKPGDIVKDKYRPSLGSGEVIKVLKTVVYIEFGCIGIDKYDASHVKLCLIKQ